MALIRPATATAASPAPHAPAPDQAALLSRLVCPDAPARRMAAGALAAFPEAAAVLGRRLQLEADETVREVLFTSLARIGGETVAETMLQLLRSDDAALRNGAIEVLAGLPDEVAPALDALLRDADGDVRVFAVNLLLELRVAGVDRWLLPVLRDETEVNVVAAAIEVVCEAGTPALAQAVEACARRFADEPFIAFAAGRARRALAAD